MATGTGAALTAGAGAGTAVATVAAIVVDGVGKDEAWGGVRFGDNVIADEEEHEDGECLVDGVDGIED